VIRPIARLCIKALKPNNTANPTTEPLTAPKYDNSIEGSSKDDGILKFGI
jgi:hypothetical protein